MKNKYVRKSLLTDSLGSSQNSKQKFTSVQRKYETFVYVLNSHIILQERKVIGKYSSLNHLWLSRNIAVCNGCGLEVLKGNIYFLTFPACF